MNAARRLTLTMLVSLCAMAGAQLLGAASALAAPEAPKVEEEFTSDVASTSATLDARVNPQGAETAYTFEYAPAGGAFKPVPEPEGSGSLPEGDIGVPVSVHVQGLVQGASYEFRVVASNVAQQGVTGEPASFTTQRAVGEFLLPDGRQYEMVTPPQKEGALFDGLGSFYATSAHVVQASAQGNAIADLASQPTEAEPPGYADGVSVLSTRSAGGWSSQVIAPPHALESALGENGISEYVFFSEDLSRGLVQPFGVTNLLSSDASEQTPYLHTDYLNGNVGERCQASCYQPLVTRANTRMGAEFGGGRYGENPCTRIICGPEFEGASADLSHVVISSAEQLTSMPVEVGSIQHLYEWSGGKLLPVSVYPEDEGVLGEADLAGSETPFFGTPHQDVGTSHAVSEDGNRVIFEHGGLYLRDLQMEKTVRLDAPEPGCGTCSNGKPVYTTANSDASRVFFLDAGRLTQNSGAVSATQHEREERSDLYECEVVEGAGGRLECKLSDLTPAGAGGEAGEAIAVLGTSSDGAYVYFAAGGAFAPGAVRAAPGSCGRFYNYGETTEGCNLYVRHDGATSLVAAGWIEGGGHQTGPAEWARVSPDGRWLAFMSSRALTGYDNRDAVSGQPDSEVYLYDASTGRLACASCDPTGARPLGRPLEVGGVAANVPGLTTTLGDNSFYQSRYLSDSGRLFFESSVALVPRDVNGAQDVYEYEPEGVGSCTSSASSGSVVFKPARSVAVEGREVREGAGCVGLISSGTSDEESSFLDASQDGGDVFFLTSSKLASQDFDSSPDVYDAHECTPRGPCIPPPVAQPPACTTEASCRPSPVPQPSIYGLPSSATFSGLGDVQPLSSGKPTTKVLPQAKRLAAALRACRRDRRRLRRARCERAVRGRYGATRAGRARKSSDERRAG